MSAEYFTGPIGAPNERNCFHTNVFRALQVAVHLDGRQAEGSRGRSGTS